ncbi:MAG: trehalose-6-phosphate synthase, partial [Candidatus Omnitrophica bacterium]|nr:trehalose-6-phosphate synthase [Candidatus Omnitrophota bacterium]
RTLIARGERTELTKGILEGFSALRIFLRCNPEVADRICFVSWFIPSRLDIPQYARLVEEIKTLTRSLNREFSPRATWDGIIETPDQFRESFARDWPVVVTNLAPEESWLGLCLAADVVLVNSHRDGMNLVVKIFIALNDPAFLDQVNQRLHAFSCGNAADFSPVMAVVSNTIGAYPEVADGALGINPVNEQELVFALHTALTMGMDERRERALKMAAGICRITLAQWVAAELSEKSVSSPTELPVIEKLFTLILVWDVDVFCDAWNEVFKTAGIRYERTLTHPAWQGRLMLMSDGRRIAILNMRVLEGDSQVMFLDWLQRCADQNALCTRVLVIGSCRSLDDTLRAGDIILPEMVVGEEGQDIRVENIFTPQVLGRHVPEGVRVCIRDVVTVEDATAGMEAQASKSLQDGYGAFEPVLYPLVAALSKFPTVEKGIALEVRGMRFISLGRFLPVGCIKDRVIVSKRRRKHPPFVATMDETDIRLVGGKAMGLAYLRRVPGLNTCAGFNITTHAFAEYVRSHSIDTDIQKLDALSEEWITLDILGEATNEEEAAVLKSQQNKISSRMMQLSAHIREMILDDNKSIPQQIKRAVQRFLVLSGIMWAWVADRSSSTAEDLIIASFAGGHRTVLNLKARAGIILKQGKHCWASMFNDRVVDDRNKLRREEVSRVLQGRLDIDAIAAALARTPAFSHSLEKMGVAVVTMVPTKSAAVVYDVDSGTGAPVICINAVEGLGEQFIDGESEADVLWVSAEDFELLGWKKGRRNGRLYAAEQGGLNNVELSEKEQNRFCVSDADALEVARMVQRISNYYRRHGLSKKHIDTEFALGEDGVWWALQGRPEILWSWGGRKILTVRQSAHEQAVASKQAITFSGALIGNAGAAVGRLHIVSEPDEIDDGDIIAVKKTRGYWNMALLKVVGMVVDEGATQSHPAQVGRERNIPVIVATHNGREVLQLWDGQIVTFDASRKTLYLGELPLVVKEGIVEETGEWTGKRGFKEIRAEFLGNIRREPGRVIEEKGVEWEGRPPRPLNPYDRDILVESFLRKGLALERPLDVRIDENGVIRIRLETEYDLLETLMGLPIERLEELVGLRMSLCVELLEHIQNYSSTARWYQELREHTIVFTYHRLICDDIYAILDNNLAGMFSPGGEAGNVPLKFRLALLEALEEEIPDSASLEQRNDLLKILILARKHQSIVTQGDYEECVARIRKECPQLWKMILYYAVSYRHPKSSGRIPPIKEIIIEDIREGLWEFSPSLRRKGKGFDELLAEFGIRDYFSCGRDFEEFRRTMILYVRTAKEKETLLHRREQIRFALIEKQLLLGGFLAQYGLIAHDEEIFDLTTAEVVERLGDIRQTGGCPAFCGKVSPGSSSPVEKEMGAQDQIRIMLIERMLKTLGFNGHEGMRDLAVRMAFGECRQKSARHKLEKQLRALLVCAREAGFDIQGWKEGMRRAILAGDLIGWVDNKLEDYQQLSADIWRTMEDLRGARVALPKRFTRPRRKKPGTKNNRSASSALVFLNAPRRRESTVKRVKYIQQQFQRGRRLSIEELRDYFVQRDAPMSYGMACRAFRIAGVNPSRRNDSQREAGRIVHGFTIYPEVDSRDYYQGFLADQYRDQALRRIKEVILSKGFNLKGPLNLATDNFSRSWQRMKLVLGTLIENLFQHEFGDDSRLVMRVYLARQPYVGVRVEFWGPGKVALPDLLTSKPWFTYFNRPWFWTVPSAARSLDTTGFGGMIHCAFDSLHGIERDFGFSGKQHILLGWREDEQYEGPRANGHIIALHIPVMPQSSSPAQEENRNDPNPSKLEKQVRALLVCAQEAGFDIQIWKVGMRSAILADDLAGWVDAKLEDYRQLSADLWQTIVGLHERTVPLPKRFTRRRAKKPGEGSRQSASSPVQGQGELSDEKVIRYLSRMLRELHTFITDCSPDRQLRMEAERLIEMVQLLEGLDAFSGIWDGIGEKLAQLRTGIDPDARDTFDYNLQQIPQLAEALRLRLEGQETQGASSPEQEENRNVPITSSSPVWKPLAIFNELVRVGYIRSYWSDKAELVEVFLADLILGSLSGLIIYLFPLSLGKHFIVTQAVKEIDMTVGLIIIGGICSALFTHLTHVGAHIGTALVFYSRNRLKDIAMPSDALAFKRERLYVVQATLVAHPLLGIIFLIASPLLWWVGYATIPLFALVNAGMQFRKAHLSIKFTDGPAIRNIKEEISRALEDERRVERCFRFIRRGAEERAVLQSQHLRDGALRMLLRFVSEERGISRIIKGLKDGHPVVRSVSAVYLQYIRTRRVDVIAALLEASCDESDETLREHAEDSLDVILKGTQIAVYEQIARNSSSPINAIPGRRNQMLRNLLTFASFILFLQMLIFLTQELVPEARPQQYIPLDWYVTGLLISCGAVWFLLAALFGVMKGLLAFSLKSEYAQSLFVHTQKTSKKVVFTNTGIALIFTLIFQISRDGFFIQLFGLNSESYKDIFKTIDLPAHFWWDCLPDFFCSAFTAYIITNFVLLLPKYWIALTVFLFWYTQESLFTHVGGFDWNDIMAYGVGASLPLVSYVKDKTAYTTWNTFRTASSPINVVVIGGLGAVIQRFYMPFFEELAQQNGINLICVDVAPEEYAHVFIRQNEKLPTYAGYVRAEERLSTRGMGLLFQRISAQFGEVNGIMVCSRTNTHWAYVEWAVKHNIPVAVEKPLVLPEQLPQVLTLHAQYPHLIFAVDFFLDNPSVRDIGEWLKEVGKIKAIRGWIVESFPIEKGRDWLVERSINGGGLGMDAMVHLVAIAAVVLKSAGREDTLLEMVFHPQNTFFARYIRAPPGEETYAHVNAHAAGVELDFQAGKGIHITRYGVIVEGIDDTVLEVDFGTETTLPFLRLTKENTVIREITYQAGVPGYREGDLGYYGTLEQFFSFVSNPASFPRAELDFRFLATF